MLALRIGSLTFVPYAQPFAVTACGTATFQLLADSKALPVARPPRDVFLAQHAATVGRLLTGCVISVGAVLAVTWLGGEPAWLRVVHCDRSPCRLTDRTQAQFADVALHNALGHTAVAASRHIGAR